MFRGNKATVIRGEFPAAKRRAVLNRTARKKTHMIFL